jgi:lysozyme
MRSRQATLVFASVALAAATVTLALAPSGAMAGKRPLGIDVSRFQGTIDWTAVAGSGVRFAFVAASRGSGGDCAVRPESCGADPFFATHRTNARAAGIPIGAYHRAFASGATIAAARADAAAEANVFITQVGAIQAGELLPVLDVESPFAGLNAKRLTVWVRTWLKRVRAATGQRAMIYTNATSWRATGNTLEFARAGHRLWIAQWRVKKPTFIPARKWNGKGWSVWQFTSSGSVAGIAGRVDLDRLRVGLGKISVR